MVDVGAFVEFRSLKDSVSTEEWEARQNLAACCRMIEHFGFNGTINNHVSLRVPGERDHFLINPGGYLFSELCASSFVKIHHNGDILSHAPTGIVNSAGYILHSAIQEGRPDVNCVIHLHTASGIAVGNQKEGLKFYCQEAARYIGRFGFNDYEGFSRNIDEKEVFKRDLADNIVLFMRNHGTVVCAPSVADAFTWALNFERACAAQLATESMRGDVIATPSEVAEKTREQTRLGARTTGDHAWKAYRRLADAYYPSYRN